MVKTHTVTHIKSSVQVQYMLTSVFFQAKESTSCTKGTVAHWFIRMRIHDEF